jgi:hypothetical protein
MSNEKAVDDQPAADGPADLEKRPVIVRCHRTQDRLLGAGLERLSGRWRLACCRPEARYHAQGQYNTVTAYRSINALLPCCRSAVQLRASRSEPELRV